MFCKSISVIESVRLRCVGSFRPESSSVTIFFALCHVMGKELNVVVVPLFDFVHQKQKYIFVPCEAAI